MDVLLASTATTAAATSCGVRLAQGAVTDCAVRTSGADRRVSCGGRSVELKPWTTAGRLRVLVRSCQETKLGEEEAKGRLREDYGSRLRHSLLSTAAAAAVSLSVSWCGADLAAARPAGVNRPELLPESFTPIIDVAGFLTPQQESRIVQDVTALEEETGFKLRVLAQNYPETPGLAVKNFWQVDDNTVVFVADPSMGNILNFNVGASVDLNVPRSFWSRLAGKYGNIFFWREQGEDASIEAAVAAIGECLREPAGPRACAEIK